MVTVAVAPRRQRSTKIARDAAVDMAVRTTHGFNSAAIQRAIDHCIKLLRAAKEQKASSVVSRDGGFIRFIYAMMTTGAETARRAIEELLLGSGKQFEIDEQRSSDRSVTLLIISS